MDMIRLTIKDKDRVLSIPFKSIIDVDNFTILFDNYLELVATLNKILNLKIRNVEMVDIYITYAYKKHSSDLLKTQYLPIKYSHDNYDIQDLERVYADYYKDDYTRIKTTREGIYNVKHEAIFSYISGDSSLITDNDIDMAVKAYFSNYSYKKYRDAYFRVTDIGYKVKINKMDINAKKIDRTNLSKYDMSSTYFNNLANYASIGENEHARVMDELAGYTFEELNHDLNNLDYTLFDGMGKKKENIDLDKDDMLALESLTGYDIDTLSRYVNKENKEHRR